MKAKALSAVLLAAVLLAGCGKPAEEGDLAYEQPLNTLRLAVNYNDEQSYLSVWMPCEKQRFLDSTEVPEDFLENAYDRDAFDGKITLRINSAQALSDEELDALREQTRQDYGVRPDFSKGMIVNAELRVRKNTEIMSDARDYTLVRLENNWYICGETITEFSFTAS